MTSPLEGSLAKTVYKAMKNLFINATLSRDVVTSGSPDMPFDPPAAITSTYACKAIVENYSGYYMANGLVEMNDRKVIILAQSLAVTPVPGDRITIRSQTFRVMQVTSDPAIATWECQGRL